MTRELEKAGDPALSRPSLVPHVMVSIPSVLMHRTVPLLNASHSPGFESLHGQFVIAQGQISPSPAIGLGLKSQAYQDNSCRRTAFLLLGIESRHPETCRKGLFIVL